VNSEQDEDEGAFAGPSVADYAEGKAKLHLVAHPHVDDDEEGETRPLIAAEEKLNHATES